MNRFTRVAVTLVLGAALGVLGYRVASVVVPATMPDDKSFFHTAAIDEWPSDKLSPHQYEDAVAHFASYDACKLQWQWALIARNEWLLEGTRYHVVKVVSDGFVPNVHYNRGYWGDGRGTYFNPVPPVALVKAKAEADAAEDCDAGMVMQKLDPNDLPDNGYVEAKYRTEEQ